MNQFKTLSAKIEDRSAVVGIIGIGYVGSALAEGSSAVGFQTIGFTRSPFKAKNINDQNIKNYTATTDNELLSHCDIICICVPTPIHEDKSPDLEPILDSLEKTAKYIRKGTLVIIESTIAPGTTRKIALPILKETGLVEEKEFFLSFSPERVDPGNPTYGIFNTPKVVGGLTGSSCYLAYKFYRSFIEKVVPVSSLEVAEMSKILENTFRLVNISISNELLPYADKLGIDLWEVISAAATKPFGFMPHYPGPGIGGHCIPVDPYYLMDDARNLGVPLQIIEAAGRVNDAQPKKVVERAIDIIQQTNGVKKDHTAILIGLTYKENVPDDRESPSIKILKLLKERNIDVDYHDPYIPEFHDLHSVPLSDSTLADKDIIIITTPHSSIDYENLVNYKKPILDTKNILKKYPLPYIYRI